MKIKSYVLIAALILISSSILIKDSFSNNQYVATMDGALLIDGQALNIKVDIYQNSHGVKRLKLVNPVELKSIKIDLKQQ